VGGLFYVGTNSNIQNYLSNIIIFLYNLFE